jgi:hypothetical protein
VKWKLDVFYTTTVDEGEMSAAHSGWYILWESVRYAIDVRLREPHIQSGQGGEVKFLLLLESIPDGQGRTKSLYNSSIPA